MVILLAIGAACGDFSDNFCDRNLCKTCVSDGEPIPRHVACLDPGAPKFSTKCPAGVKEVTMTDALKTLLLSEHNKVRSDAACGRLPGFSPCNRMIENVSQIFTEIFPFSKCIYYQHNRPGAQS